MSELGDRVVSFLSAARERVLIVAPFIRSEALGPILQRISDGVETTVVTRWRLADLVAGASDLAVFDLVEREGGALYTRNDLHAKVFAADDECMVGSANVTRSAFGWREPKNLELLVSVAREREQLVHFEAELLVGAVLASRARRDLLETLLGRCPKLANLAGAGEADELGVLPRDWVPHVMDPAELYAVYCGDSDVSRLTRPAAEKDLAEIGVIPGMDEEEFRLWVGAALSSSSLVASVLRSIDRVGHVSEAELGELLGRRGVDPGEHRLGVVLDALGRWLSYFLPAQYQTATDSVRLVRARRV